MTTQFSNSSPKLPKSGVFGPKFKHFCFFVKFCKQTNLRMLISNLTIVLCQKYPNKAFLVPDIRHFCFFTKFCNYTNTKVLILNMNLKFQPKNTQIRHFWSQIFRHFHYFTIFCNQTNSRVLISNLTIVFKILAQKYSNKAFLVKNTQEMAFLIPNVVIFVSSQNFAIRQIRSCRFQI